MYSLFGFGQFQTKVRMKEKCSGVHTKLGWLHIPARRHSLMIHCTWCEAILMSHDSKRRPASTCCCYRMDGISSVVDRDYQSHGRSWHLRHGCPGENFYDNFMSFGPFALNVEDRGEETRKFVILQFILGLISFWPPISFHARMWDNSLTYSRLENYFIGRVARDHPALYTIRSAHRQQLIML